MIVTKWVTRWVLHALLQRVRDGAFRLIYWDGTEAQFGKGWARFSLRLHGPPSLRAILRSVELGLGEAFMEGRIEVDDLDALLEMSMSQEWQSPLRLPSLRRLRLRRERTVRRRQVEEVQHHYDLGNAFFALWLESSRTYSCAYFECPDATLEEAQAAKRRHVLRKLQLQPGQRLLDIGCGWGALLFDAAREYGVQAHGITLSRQQYDFVRERAGQLGLQNRVRVELVDYREFALRDRGYDRVVSVGMFEHVGQRHHRDFMEAVARLLEPGGLMLLHTVTRRKDLPASAWIRRYLFPGSYVPPWPWVVRLLAEAGFELLDVEDLRLHYALTAEQWSQPFEARLDEVRALGYDERFIRMWRLYLRGGVAMFQYGDYSLHQFLVSLGHSSSPQLSRAYLYADGRSTADPRPPSGDDPEPDREDTLRGH